MEEFEAVYSQHFALVWRALRRFGVPPWLVEDGVQEVFLVWLRQSAQFRGDAQVSSYLYAIARRVAANMRRSAKREERRHHTLQHHRPDNPVPTPEDTFAKDQTAAAFAQALAKLPPKLHDVYRLSVQEGLTAQQVGVALGISANTVSSRLRLTRNRLVAELNPADAPSDAARTRVWLALVPLVAHIAAPSAAAASARTTPMLAVAAVVTTVATLALLLAPQPAAVSQAPVDPRAPATILPNAPPPVAAKATAQVRPPPPEAEDPLAREARLLATAQRFLRAERLDAAMTTLRRHAQVFPNGVLADERDALIAAAWCQGGELEKGRAAAIALAKRAPTSSALATAQTACQKNSGDE